MSTYSPDLRIELIANGAQAGTWGTTTNDTWAYVIDPAITGFQTVAVSSADQALTYVSGSTSTASANQAIYASLAFTTSTGANFNVYAPPASKQYIIWNNSSYTLTIYNSTVLGNTTAAGAGVAVPAGKKVQVFSTGTNFYSVDAANLTGTLAIANGGTGQTTQQGAINALAGATTNARFLRGDGTNVSMSAIQASDVPTLNQNTTGTAAGLSATLAIGSGGTGQTTQQAAINALAGATTSGQYLRGNGTNVSMSAIQAADVPTLNQNTTGTAAGLSSTLVVGSGGTGATTASGARTNLGLAIGTDIPSTTGGGASGTWSISVSGNAATATNPASGGSFITSSNIGSQSVNYASSAGSASTASTATTATQFTTASGSAPSYGIRAWVNFDGTGTTGTNQTIRGSGNVASVYKNNTGNYTVNFSTAMQDANYSVSGISADTARNVVIVDMQAGSFQFWINDYAVGNIDSAFITLMFIR